MSNDILTGPVLFVPLKPVFYRGVKAFDAVIAYMGTRHVNGKISVYSRYLNKRIVIDDVDLVVKGRVD